MDQDRREFLKTTSLAGAAAMTGAAMTGAAMTGAATLTVTPAQAQTAYAGDGPRPGIGGRCGARMVVSGSGCAPTAAFST